MTENGGLVSCLAPRQTPSWLPTNRERTGKDPVPRDPGPRSTPPNIDTAVVRLLAHARPILTGQRRVAFGDLVRSAFVQRRNNLCGTIDPDAAPRP